MIRDVFTAFWQAVGGWMNPKPGTQNPKPKPATPRQSEEFLPLTPALRTLDLGENELVPLPLES